MTSAVWYQDGLSFRCTQCGNCCGGAPGYVWVSDQEIADLAQSVGLDEDSFRRRYTQRVGKRGITLRDQGRKGRYFCIFYDQQRGCTVYEQRPKQCRTWPFWHNVVADEASWEAESAACPGMNTGTKYAAEQVSAVAADDGLAGN